jgi:hypothetical protein
MKYLAETAQDVYEIFINGVNAIIPKINLPLSLMGESLTVEIVASNVEDNSPYYKKVVFKTVKKPELLRGIILHQTDRMPAGPRRVDSVEDLFMHLTNMRSSYKKITVNISRELDI